MIYNPIVDIYSMLPIYTIPLMGIKVVKEGKFKGTNSNSCIAVL